MNVFAQLKALLRQLGLKVCDIRKIIRTVEVFDSSISLSVH